MPNKPLTWGSVAAFFCFLCLCVSILLTAHSYLNVPPTAYEKNESSKLERMREVGVNERETRAGCCLCCLTALKPMSQSFYCLFGATLLLYHGVLLSWLWNHQIQTLSNFMNVKQAR